jgi:hypothetical protein
MYVFMYSLGSPFIIIIHYLLSFTYFTLRGCYIILEFNLKYEYKLYLNCIT